MIRSRRIAAGQNTSGESILLDRVRAEAGQASEKALASAHDHPIAEQRLAPGHQEYRTPEDNAKLQQDCRCPDTVSQEYRPADGAAPWELENKSVESVH